MFPLTKTQQDQEIGNAELSVQWNENIVACVWWRFVMFFWWQRKHVIVLVIQGCEMLGEQQKNQQQFDNLIESCMSAKLMEKDQCWEAWNGWPQAMGTNENTFFSCWSNSQLKKGECHQIWVPETDIVHTAECDPFPKNSVFIKCKNVKNKIVHLSIEQHSFFPTTNLVCSGKTQWFDADNSRVEMQFLDMFMSREMTHSIKQQDFFSTTKSICSDKTHCFENWNSVHVFVKGIVMCDPNAGHVCVYWCRAHAAQCM